MLIQKEKVKQEEELRQPSKDAFAASKDETSNVVDGRLKINQEDTVFNLPAEK